MDRLKTFLIYALIVVGFIVFSEFLITVSLNASYKDIERRDTTSQVEISQAQATLVNGRIKGTIKDSPEDNLTGKYVEVDLYSERDNMVGQKTPLDFLFELKEMVEKHPNAKLIGLAPTEDLEWCYAYYNDIRVRYDKIMFVKGKYEIETYDDEDDYLEEYPDGKWEPEEYIIIMVDN